MIAVEGVTDAWIVLFIAVAILIGIIKILDLRLIIVYIIEVIRILFLIMGYLLIEIGYLRFTGLLMESSYTGSEYIKAGSKQQKEH